MRAAKLFPLVLTTVLLVSFAHAATWKGFREDTLYPGNGYKLVVADFNRDGKPDAVGMGYPDTLSVYLGNGHGFNSPSPTCP